MMVRFTSLKLEQLTIEDRVELPEVGDRISDLGRFSGKVFEVASVDARIHRSLR